MKILLLLALRNLFRNTRRTLLTLSTISIGLAVVLWLECILAGRNKSMIDQITSSRTGHLQIHRKDYLADRLIQQSFPFSEETLLNARAAERYIETVMEGHHLLSKSARVSAIVSGG